MRITKHLVLVLALMLWLATGAFATPFFAGSELLNWDFSEWTQVTAANGTVVIVPADWFQDPTRYPVKMGDQNNISNWYNTTVDDGLGVAKCRVPTAPLWDNHFRQVTDDSLSPFWIPNGTGKYLDLTLDVGHTRSAGSAAGQTHGVKVRLDWWVLNDEPGPGNNPVGLPDPWATGMTWSQSGSNFYIVDPNNTVVDTLTSDGGPINVFANGNYRWTEWMTMTWDDATIGTDEWVREWNPFNRMFIDDFQPRWVSVEVEWLQPSSYTIAIDNVRLTSKCVPEIPAALLAPFGLAALAVVRRKFAR